MRPLLTIYTILLVPFFAYGSAWLLNRIISRSYEKLHKELEYPDSLTPGRQQRRLYILALALLFPYGMALTVAETWTGLFIYLLYMAILTAITVMDFEQQVIPDEFIIALVLLGLLAIPLLSLGWLSHLLAGICSFILFMAIAVITHGGLGGGDIKLIGALGLFLGVDRIIFTVATGIIAGGLVSLALLLSKRKSRKDAIAYGPYFAIAAMLALFWT